MYFEKYLAKLKKIGTNKNVSDKLSIKTLKKCLLTDHYNMQFNSVTNINRLYLHSIV